MDIYPTIRGEPWVPSMVSHPPGSIGSCWFGTNSLRVPVRARAAGGGFVFCWFHGTVAASGHCLGVRNNNILEETPSELLTASRLPNLHAQRGKRSDHPDGINKAIMFADISREQRREQKLGTKARNKSLWSSLELQLEDMGLNRKCQIQVAFCWGGILNLSPGPKGGLWVWSPWEENYAENWVPREMKMKGKERKPVDSWGDGRSQKAGSARSLV